MRELKIATIGAWGHLGRVLGELDATPLRVSAMCAAATGEDPRTYQQRHRCAAGAKLYDDHVPLLDEVRPDVVVISTRLDRITPIAIEAARRGCHLICEKPLAIEHASLRELWDACRGSGVQCLAILDNRVQPAVAAARLAVEQGLLGTVALVNARKSYKWGDRPEWFGRRSEYGGTIPWVGIHALDYIHTVTGQSFTSVAAMHSNVSHPERPECEDNCALTVRLSGGGHATASLDLLRPGAADTHGDDWLRVVGSHGVLEAEITRNRCTLITRDKPAHDLPLPPREPYFVPLLESIRSGSAPATPAEEMLKAFMLTHVSLCARDAADRGTVINISSEFAQVGDLSQPQMNTDEHG